MTPPVERTVGRTSSGRLRIGYASLVSLLVVSGCLAPGGFSGGVERTATETVADAPTNGPPSASEPTTATDDGEEPTHANESVSPGDKESQPDALESSLYGLVAAENRTAYAETWDLTFRNGSVEVVVELRDGRQLPDEFDGSVQSRYENLVQATVSVDELVALSEHENVSFVRSPRRADAHHHSSTSPTDDS